MLNLTLENIDLSTPVTVRLFRVSEAGTLELANPADEATVNIDGRNSVIATTLSSAYDVDCTGAIPFGGEIDAQLGDGTGKLTNGQEVQSFNTRQGLIDALQSDTYGLEVTELTDWPSQEV